MLDSVVSGYAAAARAANTWRAYRSDHARFAAWCAAQEPVESALPAAPVVLARYLAAHAGARRPSTLARWCSAIAVAHDLAGHPSPTRDEQVRTVLAGIRRTHRTRPARVAAVSPDDLRAMMIPLDPRSPRDAWDRALLLIGFAGALRRSELVALRIADVALDSDGLRIVIAPSKIDPGRSGTPAGWPTGPTRRRAPVRAWRAWLEHRTPSPTTHNPVHAEAAQPVPGSTGTGDAPRPVPAAGAFVPVDRWSRLGDTPLSDRSVARIVAARADAAGLVGHWAGHSLRPGFATRPTRAGRRRSR